MDATLLAGFWRPGLHFVPESVRRRAGSKGFSWREWLGLAYGEQECWACQKPGWMTEVTLPFLGELGIVGSLWLQILAVAFAWAAWRAPPCPF